MVAPHLQEAPFAEFCGDVVMGGDTTSIEHTNPIGSELFDSTPILSVLFPTALLMCIHFTSPEVTLEVIIPPLIHIVHS